MLGRSLEYDLCRSGQTSTSIESRFISVAACARHRAAALKARRVQTLLPGCCPHPSWPRPCSSWPQTWWGQPSRRPPASSRGRKCRQGWQATQCEKQPTLLSHQGSKLGLELVTLCQTGHQEAALSPCMHASRGHNLTVGTRLAAGSTAAGAASKQRGLSPTWAGAGSAAAAAAATSSSVGNFGGLP